MLDQSPITTTVEAINFSFYFIVWSSVVLLLGITAAMIYYVIRYRASKNPTPSHIEGNTALEIAWTVIPTILVMVMFYYGWVGYQATRDVPEDAMVVRATGQMWSWIFEYENGKTDSDLYVPVNKPVKLVLTSRDVNHSLYIAAFKIKEDCIPGRENYMWFEATRTGEYDIQCAEYCGTKHSAMLAKLYVQPEDEFETWYNTITPPGEMSGDKMLRLRGCLSCHSMDGTPGIGPTFKGIFGRKEVVRVRGGEFTITVDEEYLRESILYPDAKIVKGYPAGQMPAQEGLLAEEELQAIVDYLRGL